jgi:hypothetical protein
VYLSPLQHGTEWQWVKRRAGVILCEDSGGVVARMNDGSIAAISVFDSFTQSSCCVHMAIDRPIVLRHGFLEEVARQVFLVRDRKRIFGLTPENNERALRLNYHIGFRRVGHIPDAFDDGVGYVVLRMNKEECRWLDAQKEAA